MTSATQSRRSGENRLGVIGGRLLDKLKYDIRSARHRLFDNFEFVHINRTGGTSIVKALGLPFEHKTALEIIGRMGQAQWDKRFSFAFVRNPWDKVVSHYHHRVQINLTELGVKTIPFNTWVGETYRDQNPAYYDPPLMFAPQLDWISGQDGALLVDFVGRFERLEADFSAVAGRIGRSVSLPHLNSSIHKRYREYYNDEAATIVAAWFRNDIDAFGYTFEG